MSAQPLNNNRSPRREFEEKDNSHLFGSSLPKLNTFYYTQCRTIDCTILFKKKFSGRPEESPLLVVKIYDISQKCLFKKTFTSDAVGLSPEQVSLEEFPSRLLRHLAERKLVPKDHLPPDPQEATLEQCIQEIKTFINKLKPKINIENSEIQKFICPITYEIFREPVIDDHGHTFERSAIESYRDKPCPINRQPIKTLTPNRIIQQTIEEAQNKTPIPTFALFIKPNPVLAGRQIETARLYVNEGEYEDALKCYAEAFKYTKDISLYAELPLLYEKMGQKEKASLARLYLVLYQLHERKIAEAIQNLEQARDIDYAPFVVILYMVSKQFHKALAVALQAAEPYAKQNPVKAEDFYGLVLALAPDHLEAHKALSLLVESPDHKAHLLLKLACYALEGKDYGQAKEFCKKAEAYKTLSFVDQLIQLDILRRQGSPQVLKEELLRLAQQELPQKLKIYKMLVQIDNDPRYYQEIIALYKIRQSPQKDLTLIGRVYQIFQNLFDRTSPAPQKVLAWQERLLPLLIQAQAWQEAESLAQEMLKSAPSQIPLYNTLEIIYTQWQSHKLCDLYSQLGKVQLQNNQISQAEATYRKAFERFHTLDHALALAQTLQKQQKIPESVHTYYEAATLALLEDDLATVDLTVREIREIDPQMQTLDPSQRMHLLTQRKIFQLQLELTDVREQLKRAKLIEPIKEVVLAFPKNAFGKAAWREYFGVDTGKEPPLPPNIDKILNSLCPFWKNKKVHETHLLTLIPTTVNGKPLTLALMGELVQKPLKGNATKYDSFNLGAYKDVAPAKAHWVLLTKDVLEGSRAKSYGTQAALVEEHAKKSKLPYTVPKVLDVAVSLFVEYVKTGTCLYGQNPRIYTHCQEKYDNNWQLVVGGFAPGGLSVSSHSWDLVNDGVGASREF